MGNPGESPGVRRLCSGPQEKRGLPAGGLPEGACPARQPRPRGYSSAYTRVLSSLVTGLLISAVSSWTRVRRSPGCMPRARTR